MNFMTKMVPCLLAVISVSGLARATPIVVWEAPVAASESVATGFEFDAKLGRAWVDIELNDWRVDESGAVSTVMKKVEGLYYDSDSKQVLYRLGDRLIVCVEEARFLFIPVMKATGKCPLLVSSEERTVDDGFHLSKQNFVKVTLGPQV